MVRANCTHETRTVGQLNHADNDLFFQQNKPPPPPGKEDQWELQFCRWWGWNWVKKNDQFQTKQNQKRRCVEKKVKKKHLVDLCNCLCFKKDTEKTSSLQNCYNTPSHTVVCDTYACCSAVQQKIDDSLTRLEVQRRISRNGVKNCGCKENCVNCGQALYSDKRKEEWSSSSAEQCCNSSSEDSVKYLNIKCQCRCYQCQAENQKPIFRDKCDCETQTENYNAKKELPINCACMHKRGQKKKRKLIVTCHCCCCKCLDNLDAHATQTDKGQETEVKQKSDSTFEEDKRSRCETCQCLNAQRPPVMQVFHGKPIYENNDRIHKKSMQYNHLYPGNLDALDMMMHNDKQFSKFGNPSKQYPWVQRTRSDILDHFYSLKLEKEFSSPISGKIYNLLPLKLENIEENKCSNLPNLMDVKENIRNLKKIESEAKMNLQSRLMLDAMCDAILHDEKGTECTSSLINEFTFLDYDENMVTSNIKTETVPTNIDAVIKNIDDKVIETKLSNTCIFPRKHIVDTNYSTYFHSSINNQVIKDLINNFMNEDGVQIRNNEHPVTVETPNSHVENNNTILGSYLSTDCQKYSDILIPGETTHSKSIKRSASPIFIEGVKKIRSETLEETGTSNLVRNVDELFNKIDEIAYQTKTNDERIRRVMYSLPETINKKPNVDKYRGEYACSEVRLQDIAESSEDKNNKLKSVAVTSKSRISFNKVTEDRMKDEYNGVETITLNYTKTEIKDRSLYPSSDDMVGSNSNWSGNRIKDNEPGVLICNTKQRSNSKRSMIPVKKVKSYVNKNP